MTSNSTRSVCTRRRIGRILCRALTCAAGLALASASAHAQPTLAQMAYRADLYDLYFELCVAACDHTYSAVYIVRTSSIVTPGGWYSGSKPTWSPDGSL